MQNIILQASRIILAVIFLCAGLNGWLVILGFAPVFPTSHKAMELLHGYLLILEKTTEIFCALLLLTNLFVPLALTILTPIVVNILAFHLFVDSDLIVLAIIVFFLHGFLLISYRNHFRSLLSRF